MDALDYPLPRETRESAVLNGDGGASYGPFAFKIFDEVDVKVFVRPDGEGVFSAVDFTVTKTAALAYDTFSIELDEAITADDELVVISTRLHERLVSVTRGGALSSAQLEKELSKQGTVIQELRRDLGRALLADHGQAGPVMNADELAIGDTLMIGAGNTIVAGPAAADINAVQGYAVAAATARDGAEEAREAAETAAEIAAISASNTFQELDSRAYAIASYHPVVAPNKIRVAGYHEAGDGGGAIYKKVASDPTGKGKFRILLDDGETYVWYEIVQNEHNTMCYGAIADGTAHPLSEFYASLEAAQIDYPHAIALTDSIDWAAAQLAANQAGLTYAPGGSHYLNRTLVIDNSGHTANAGVGGAGLAGDGPNITTFLNASDSVGIKVRADLASSVATTSRIVIRDFKVSKVGSNTGDIGIDLDTLVVFALYNVFCSANTIGMKIQDCVLGSFYNCRWDHNRYGLTAVGMNSDNGGELSTANGVSFYGCSFYGNVNFAAYLYGITNVQFYGGDCANSYGGADAFRWGIKVEAPGNFGAAALLVEGMYFEHNSNVADIWVQATDYPITLNITGCSFNRQSDDADEYVTNNILFENNGNTNIWHTFNLIGNGFRQYDPYEEDSGRKYWAITGGTPVKINAPGNYYNVEAERPTYRTGEVYCQSIINNLSTTPAVLSGTNVSGIVRNSTGNYTITHIWPSHSGFKNLQWSMDIARGSANVTGATTTTTTIQVVDASGVAADPAQLNIVIFE